MSSRSRQIRGAGCRLIIGKQISFLCFFHSCILNTHNCLVSGGYFSKVRVFTPSEIEGSYHEFQDVNTSIHQVKGSKYSTIIITFHEIIIIKTEQKVKPFHS